MHTVDEVIEDILHGKADTGAETSRNKAEGPRGDLEEEHYHGNVGEPHYYAYDALSKGKVHVI